MNIHLSLINHQFYDQLTQNIDSCTKKSLSLFFGLRYHMLMLQVTIIITISSHYWLQVYQLTFYHDVMTMLLLLSMQTLCSFPEYIQLQPNSFLSHSCELHSLRRPSSNAKESQACNQFGFQPVNGKRYKNPWNWQSKVWPYMEYSDTHC
jgi:hypothetical protein